MVGGQTLSLALILLAIPVAYSLFDDLGAWWRRRLGAKSAVDRGEAELATMFQEIGADSTDAPVGE